MHRALAFTIFALAAAAVPGDAREARGTAAELTLPAGFRIETIARIDGPRELAVAANGDLFVGTLGDTVAVVPNAQGAAGEPQTFARVNDRPAAGVAIDRDTLYVGGQFGVYAVRFHPGDRSATEMPRKIAALRPSGEARGHRTTTVAVAGDTLYASVGSSCNNCRPDIDPTRATIQRMNRDGSAQRPAAMHIRNAIALTVDPRTQALWAGVAGQDELAHGHPYEIIDDISAHPAPADYGWPDCYENRTPVDGARDCTNVAVPRAVAPAYETPVGAVFYPSAPTGAYAFPAAYRGGLFVTLHGSWHSPPVPPRVIFIPMQGDTPRTPVRWSDPTAQWREFAGGFQTSDGTRTGRPTGIAVGTDGSLFVADDDAGAIYRIRPQR